MLFSLPSSSSSIHTLSIMSALLLFSRNDKLSLCLSQPFMSPRFPGGPRPSLRMPNQVWTTHSPIQLEHVLSGNYVLVIHTHDHPFSRPSVSLSLQGESLVLSLSCQTAWTPPGHKVGVCVCARIIHSCVYVSLQFFKWRSSLRTPVPPGPYRFRGLLGRR